MLLRRKAECGKPYLRRLEVTKEATETEEGSRERDCTVCDYVQTEIIPMLEHEHSYGDWQKDETQHWKECRCGEKLKWATILSVIGPITKEPTTTETGFQRTYLLHLQIYAGRDDSGPYARCSR